MVAITRVRYVHMVFMVKGNTQGGIMIEGDHHPSLPQKSTNAMVDIGWSDGKEKVGSDLLWSPANSTREVE